MNGSGVGECRRIDVKERMEFFMPKTNRIVSPGKTGRTVVTDKGEVLTPPEEWVLLPPGDAALTRRVKQAGIFWQVQEKRGRRTFSRGVWAPATTVETARNALEERRATPQYAKKRAADLVRREKKQQTYSREFYESVVTYLNFHPDYAEVACRLARAVTEHAVPVGSGTVARTQRISVSERAGAAVIAWMRHHTTAYDNLKIPRVKGKRREVRRHFAQISQKLLDRYRAGDEMDPEVCPLRRALERKHTD